MAKARAPKGSDADTDLARDYVAPNGMKFSISRGKGAEYLAGLRNYMVYRDLGLAASTNGRVGANIVKAVPGSKERSPWYMHLLDFQLVFVLRGWIKFNYENVGEVTLYPGDCINQAPTIRHIEIDHSDDYEGIEITMPAEFRTVGVTPPEG